MLPAPWKNSRIWQSQEAAILLELAARGPGMTYVLRNRLQMHQGVVLDTPTVLRRLRRLERSREVCEVASSYERQLCWSLFPKRDTPA